MNQQEPNGRARIAASVAFATNGALPASLLARYAEVKDILGVDAGLFGLMVAGFMIGAAAAMHTPGALLRRWCSRRVTSFGTAGMALALLAAASGATLGNPWVFVAGLVLAGYGDAVVDVSQNSQGLRVQEVHGKSVLSSMHAGWSIGAAGGGLVGVFAASMGLPLPIHMAIWGALAATTMAVAAGSFLPDRVEADTDADEPGAPRMRAVWMLAPLALVALAGVSVEDIGNNWSAILLASERGVPVAQAGVGLTVLLVAQFIGRMLGDRFIDRFGRRVALTSSLLLVAGGLNVAAWAPWASLTIVGLALAGVGCAITVPLAFAGADALPGLKAHAGVTWVNWIMRATTIVLTPAIGGITTIASLPIAITAISVVAIVAVVLEGRRKSSASPEA